MIGATVGGQSRAQSHVVGVALMLGLAVVALGTLTVGIGTLVDSQAATADARQVADSFDRAIQGAERTGYHRHRVSFSEGHLGTEERTVRIIENGTVVRSYPAGALVFENDEYRVVAVAGAVLRDSGHSGALVSRPSITSSRETGVLVVGVPTLNAGRVSVGGQGGVSKTITTNVSHRRIELGPGEYSVAIETDRPAPFERYFDERDGTVHRQHFDGDDTGSVVVTFRGTRQGYVVVHDLQLEVSG